MVAIVTLTELLSPGEGQVSLNISSINPKKNTGWGFSLVVKLGYKTMQKDKSWGISLATVNFLRLLVLEAMYSEIWSLLENCKKIVKAKLL